MSKAACKSADSENQLSVRHNKASTFLLDICSVLLYLHFLINKTVYHSVASGKNDVKVSLKICLRVSVSECKNKTAKQRHTSSV